jgi:hypothetical protein
MEYLDRLRNFWFPDLMAFAWLLLALPALYFFQTTIHEGSHATAALFVTGHFPKLAPFPHQNPAGNFLNGVTIPLADGSTSVTVSERTICNNPAPQRVTRLGGFIGTPQFVDLALILILSLIFFFTTFTTPWLRFLLRIWYLAACLDFCYNTIRSLIAGCNPTADWSRFMLGSDINPGLFAFMTWILWLVFILSHFVWVYWSGWGRATVPSTGFWDYRWIAFALGILSLIAVLLSIFVSDARIDKSSAGFIVLFIVQIGALIWYWIYFGLTFKFRDLT